MSRIVVATGDDAPGIRAALNYLEQHYGLPDSDVRGIYIAAEVGQVPLVTVELFMNDAPADEVPPGLARRLRRMGWTPPPFGPLFPADRPPLVPVPPCPVCGGCCPGHPPDGSHLAEPFICMDHHKVVEPGEDRG